MIGRALVFMIRLLSGKKRGEAGWSVDSGRLPFREGPRKAVSRRCCVLDSGNFSRCCRLTVPPACGRGTVQVLCQTLTAKRNVVEAAVLLIGVIRRIGRIGRMTGLG